MERLKVGAIGFGLRGKSVLENVLVPIYESGKIDITAICELSDEALLWGKNFLKEKINKEPLCFKDYRELLASGIDAVVVLCGWRDHVDIACEALNRGIAVGLEVGGAYSVRDCWRLVKTVEETGGKFMFLENCCYGKRELMLLNMVRRGAFGRTVHFTGGYHHDLRESLEKSAFSGRYRLKEYLKRNGDTYPSHALGPIMQMANINRGNRIVSLTSTASGAFGMEDYLERFEEHPLKSKKFAHGDMITTTLRCADGQTITLTLNTTLPSPYSRKLGVFGTKGCYNEDNDSVFINPDEPPFEPKREELWGNAEKYEEEYLHKYWKENKAFGSHGGMDGMVFTAFFDSVIKGTEPPIDVYDGALMMAITPLSEESVALGGTAVAVPDFTNGRFVTRPPLDPDKDI